MTDHVPGKAPLYLNILLHYYSMACPYAEQDEAHRTSPSVSKFHKDLIDDGLIEQGNENFPEMGYRVTEKGRAWVDHILSTPLPEQRWEVPGR